MSTATATEPTQELVRVTRTELLQQLESVSPGITASPLVEQSSCFVFRNGRVFTFNDEVACKAKTSLPPTLEAAVSAQPLLNLLRKMEDDVVKVGVFGGVFHVRGKGTRSRSGITTEKTILLPIQTVEKPTEWKELPPDFTEAVTIVQECAGKDESQFVITCIHIHPKWLEACDRFQLTRYRVATGFSKPTFIRRDSLRHVLGLDMTHFAETEKWIHFKNPTGLVLSVRQYTEDMNYPSVGQWLKTSDGAKATVLPKGLGGAADKAEIFSSETKEKNYLLVSVKDNVIQVRGQGDSGFHEEEKPIIYTGAPIQFTIAPKLLIELTKRYVECEISPDRLRVDGGKFVYVTTVGRVEMNDVKAGGG